MQAEVNMADATSWTPRLGMEFNTPDEAWNFWVTYAEKIGFDVRKHYTNYNKVGVVSSKRFLCGKQGKRTQDKREDQYKSSRAETRTRCQARMGITLDTKKNKYQVHDFVAEHNHILYSPYMVHLISSQWKISSVDAFEIDAADDAGIAPKAAHVFSGQVVGGTTNLGYTLQDRKNYLQSKHQSSLQYGEAGALLKYFQQQVIDNPSFQYAIQLDCEEKIPNIFWADAKMLIDYALFGDAITFDTTYSTNKEYRPFGVFVGFNHFRELVVFRAALLYDETVESFKWLFETFLAAHNEKKPKTIFTDQDAAMGRAISEVLVDVTHGLCSWHMSQNAIKHLSSYKDDGPTILKDFKLCMYQYEMEVEFEEVFKIMQSKVKQGGWLDGIYRLKHKWAYCYMKNAFTLGMRSTQLSESFNKDLKQYLKLNLDIVRFFKHFERAVGDKREKEVKAEHEARKRLPKLKLRGTPLLQQAANIYTPPIFTLFQEEFEKSTAAYMKSSMEKGSSIEFNVGICSLDGQLTNEQEHMVYGNPTNQTVTCTCRKFEKHGILCWHALKSLDMMNIKLIPEAYILKRWTKDARNGIVQDNKGKDILEDPKLEKTRRYKSLCRKFVCLASKAVDFDELYLLLDSSLDSLYKIVEEKLQELSVTEKSSEGMQPLPRQASVENLENRVVGLKKRQGRKSSKRPKDWVQSMQDKNKKRSTRQSKSVQEKSNKRTTSQTEQTKGPTDKVQYYNNNGVEVPIDFLYEISTSYTDLLLGRWDNSLPASHRFLSDNYSKETSMQYSQGERSCFPPPNNFEQM